MPAKNRKYMSNKEFFEELIKCQKNGRISNELGKMFKMLVERYSTKHWFSNYAYRDELVATGILACCAAFNKFDSKKGSNPFAFFTAVAHNSFLQVLNKEYRQKNIRDQLLIEANMNPSYGYIDDYADDHHNVLQEDRIGKEKEEPEVHTEAPVDKETGETEDKAVK